MQARTAKPPRPEVQYLPAIFRQIEQGEIRVPAFQRKYVWDAKQVLQLLESVYRGYPIGSVLFWRVEENVLRVETDPNLPFPDRPVEWPVNFVLDGMQRLSTLYGVFHAPQTLWTMDVAFNLNTETFRHLRDGAIQPEELRLVALLNPRALLNAQREFSFLPNGDQMIDRSLALQSVFQEYLLPTVTIEGREVEEVVEIFERINSTGTRLSTVDFMRALTWSQDFDLSIELNRLQSSAGERGFNIDPETIVKIVALMKDLAPLPDDMLALKTMAAPELHEAVAKAGNAISGAITFLQEDFGLHSYDFVPYEGQLLLISKVIGEAGGVEMLPEDFRNLVRRWFWSVGFSEGLQGRPDHFVARVINSAVDALKGEPGALRISLELSPKDLMTKIFRKGAALSSSFATLLAVSQARSFFTGDPIPTELYLSEFGSRHFQPVYPRFAVAVAAGRELNSAKALSNLVVVSESEAAEFEKVGLKEVLLKLVETDPALATEVMESQLIPDHALEALVDGRYFEFLHLRSVYIVDRVQRITLF